MHLQRQQPHFHRPSCQQSGYQSLGKQVDIIKNFPHPATACKLREVLGLINFYHCFIPHCARILQPLNTMLSCTKAAQHGWKKQPSPSIRSRRPSLVQSYSITQNLMPLPCYRFLGAVKLSSGIWCPIAYFSKRLKPFETRCRTFDRELLAMYLAIRHYRCFVEGHEFHVCTDHKPLTYASNTRPNHHSPRQIRYLDFITQFTSDIRFVKS